MPFFRQPIVILAAIVIIAGGLFALLRYAPGFRLAGGPVSGGTISPPAINETNLPLQVPPGFRISIFAKDLPEARVMRFDQFGNLWVSRTKKGAVTLLEIDRETGAVRHQDDVLTGLQNPHGLAFDPNHPLQLYIAEEHRIRRVTTYSDDPGEYVLGLPTAGGGHFTRTIAFGPASANATAGRPDYKLYISIGSSCNVCREEDERWAAVLTFNPATRTVETFARGLRNAVFFTWHPVTGKLWATEMGRDELGDDLPPDEINMVERGGDYGWPTCYGKNIHDGDFDPVPSPQAGSYGAGKNVYVRDPCADKQPSFIDIPAHSAPLGLAFIPPNSAWPEEYWYDLLVAYHGSIFRSQPTGYKVVRHKFDERGSYQGAEDFISGWLVRELGLTQAPEGALGRPVDILVQPDGTAYISDDQAGVIYRVGVIKPPR